METQTIDSIDGPGSRKAPYNVRAHRRVTRRNCRVRRAVVAKRCRGRLTVAPVAHRHAQGEGLTGRQVSIAHRGSVDDQVRATAAGRRNLLAEVLREDQKIGKSNRPVAIQIETCVKPRVAPLFPELSRKEQKVVKTNRPVAVEVRRRGGIERDHIRCCEHVPQRGGFGERNHRNTDGKLPPRDVRNRSKLGARQKTGRGQRDRRSGCEVGARGSFRKR